MHQGAIDPGKVTRQLVYIRSRHVVAWYTYHIPPHHHPLALRISDHCQAEADEEEPNQAQYQRYYYPQDSCIHRHIVKSYRIVQRATRKGEDHAKSADRVCGRGPVEGVVGGEAERPAGAHAGAVTRSDASGELDVVGFVVRDGANASHSRFSSLFDSTWRCWIFRTAEINI